MADPDPRDVPDLDLSPRAVPSKASPVSPPLAPTTSPHADASASSSDFGGELDRGQLTAMPPSSIGRLAATGSAHAKTTAADRMAIAIEESSDDFDMEIERGGALTAQSPASSGRPSGHGRSAASLSTALRPGGPSGNAARVGSGLDVAYRRTDPRPVVREGPGRGARIAAYLVPFFASAMTVAALVKLVHRRGGRNVLSLLPHAFDASSTIQSGAFALVTLVLAITIGFIGLKASRRSYAMSGSAVMLVVTSLAMVTVTLVSTDEEHATAPDGALLVPYVVPLATLLLGLGILGRGRRLFLRGGSSRALSLLVAAAGGALVFAAVELSAIAAHLP